MSSVTTVMIHVSLTEDDQHLENLSRFLEFEILRDDDRGIRGVGPLRPLTETPIDQLWGGTRVPECTIWAGAFNYLDVHKLLAAVEETEWEWPESVQVFAKGPGDSWFKVWMIREGATQWTL